jgi:hypothetical protein
METKNRFHQYTDGEERQTFRPSISLTAKQIDLLKKGHSRMFGQEKPLGVILARCLSDGVFGMIEYGYKAEAEERETASPHPSNWDPQ